MTANNAAGAPSAAVASQLNHGVRPQEIDWSTNLVTIEYLRLELTAAATSTHYR
jgi:hypothetical protein